MFRLSAKMAHVLFMDGGYFLNIIIVFDVSPAFIKERTTGDCACKYNVFSCARTCAIPH